MASGYTEASIKTLSSTEHIRLRPGMYIGRLGDGAHAEDWIYVLLKETIDNSVDEFTMGAGRRIDIELEERRAPRAEEDHAVAADAPRHARRPEQAVRRVRRLGAGARERLVEVLPGDDHGARIRRPAPRR